MACTARGARMVAMTLSRPPEREQARTSRSNTGASAGLERDVGDDLQAARGDHGVHRLSDQQHLEGLPGSHTTTLAPSERGGPRSGPRQVVYIQQSRWPNPSTSATCSTGLDPPALRR